MEKMRNVFKNLLSKTWKTIPSARTDSRWQNISEMNFKEICWEDTGGSKWGPVPGSCEHNNEPLDSKLSWIHTIFWRSTPKIVNKTRAEHSCCHCWCIMRCYVNIWPRRHISFCLCKFSLVLWLMRVERGVFRLWVAFPITGSSTDADKEVEWVLARGNHNFQKWVSASCTSISQNRTPSPGGNATVAFLKCPSVSFLLSLLFSFVYKLGMHPWSNTLSCSQKKPPYVSISMVVYYINC